MQIKNKKKALLTASIAGLLAAGSVAAFQAVANAEMGGAGVPCYGINACKGVGDCGGKGYSCAGKNTCKGQGFLKLPADTCTKIQGGKLTAE